MSTHSLVARIEIGEVDPPMDGKDCTLRVSWVCVKSLDERGMAREVVSYQSGSDRKEMIREALLEIIDLVAEAGYL